MEAGLFGNSLLKAVDTWLGANAIEIIKTETIKKGKAGAREMAQLIRANSALSEDLSKVPSIHARRPTIACHPREIWQSLPASPDLCAPIHTPTQKHRNLK